MQGTLRLSAVLASLTMLIFGCCHVAFAATWTYFDSPTTWDGFGVSGILADDSGFWLTGGTIATRDGAIARYDNDANLIWAKYMPPYANLSPTAETGDRGFFSLAETGGEQTGPYCQLSRFDSSPAALWTQDLPADCHFFGRDVTGGAWVNTQYGLYRFAADGVSKSVAAVASVTAGAVDNQTGDLYFATVGSAANAAAVYRVDVRATSTKLWTAPDSTIQLGHVSLGSDGNLYAIGTTAAGLYALSLGRDGSMRWQHAYATGEQPVQAYAAYPDGTQVALDHLLVVDEISSDGTLRFTKPTGIAPYDCACDLLATSPNGDLIVAVPHVALMRLDKDGNILATTSTPNLPEGNTLAVLADGSTLVGPNPDPMNLSYPNFMHLDRAGHALAVPETQDIFGAGSRLNTSLQAVDGTLYVATANDSDFWLSKISPDGQLIWKQHYANYRSLREWTLGADRICAAAEPNGSVTIECRSTDSGEVLWSYDANASILAAALLDDNEVVAVIAPQSRDSRLLVLSADGELEHNIDLTREIFVNRNQIGIGKNGTTVISDLQSGGEVTAWDKYGIHLYVTHSPLASEIKFDGSVSVADDGSALLTPMLGSLSDATEYLWMLSPAGKTRWLTPQTLNGVQNEPIPISNGVAYVFGSGSTFSGPTVLQKRSLADGRVLDQFDIDAADTIPVLDPITGLLLSWGQGIKINDSANGHLLRRIMPDCGTQRCDYGSLMAMTADGTLRFLHDTFDPVAGERFRVDAIGAAATPVSSVRVDQAGLAGAWYAPYEDGQGFTFDYIASAHVVFMPWFTYGFNGGADPAQLAWYALQGTSEPGARSVELDIYMTDPGTFNLGVVDTHKVGSAHLSFTDCNSGLLIYQFVQGVNNAAGGTISLTRISPSTSPCELADSTMVSAQNSNVAAQGFDARQSGSWFEPSTSGQGLQLTIIPAGNNYAGLVFAAWFTFDPANLADDPGHQHWFTLQGDLTTATNGQVTLPIYRTLGGTFDFAATLDTVQVGHATLSMQGCDKARIDYQFDLSEVAHAFAGLSGSTDLVKIGGCSTP